MQRAEGKEGGRKGAEEGQKRGRRGADCNVQNQNACQQAVYRLLCSVKSAVKWRTRTGTWQGVFLMSSGVRA